ncbi:helix-turn-helix transcriptional regulator [Ramlibacter tataouinensis]|uniref:AraC family transcriptional regulator n=1 Tax=Ramlibacter tataouinensis TaxID=94132 RepID=UPI0022F399AD|nr:helix-turn-helix transcriptional regulator [Ramlibacter tataouinensis]WBY01720.1 helix-turn-helix transcriptional regulator [Ramlibacter tataouinensis]
MPRRSALPQPLADDVAFRPTPGQPVRLRARSLPADSHFEPHRHAWAQLAYCASGVLQVTAERGGGAPDEVAYIVPPSRAVWIAPGARHSVHVLQEAQFRTLYLHADVTPAGWAGCRVLRVSPLLRELVEALDQAPLARPREQLLSALVLEELRHADPQALGVPLPPPGGDKRLRTLCEAVLRSPGERASLAGWAAGVGASERTLARLFQAELGSGYQQWRQQVVLAHALPLLARGVAVNQVAAATGYASESAFSAMFKAAMGQPPRHFQARGAVAA